MKTMFLFALAAALATPAAAQTMVTVSGPRVEARIGFDHPALTLKATDGTDSYKESAAKSGVSYGGEIGYDYGTDGMIVGAYAGIAGSSTKDCTAVYGNDEACLKAGRDITLGVRGGYVLRPNSVIYLKAGYSNGQARVDYVDYADATNNLRDHNNLDGWHVGAGVELGLGAHAYGKLEYVYTDYSGYKAALDGASGSLDLARHQVTAGLGWRF
jgi:outer membrane immunogenic protein